jgi:predicted nucleotidyltransferase
MVIINIPGCRTSLEVYFASQTEVVLAYLYGSQARGQANPLSDVDIAVLLTGQPDAGQCFDARLMLIGDLTHLLHTDEVDVAILNQTPPALNYRVLRDGLSLFCRDRDHMLSFRVRVINEFLDFMPILERHEHAILEKARKGELLNGYNPYRGALERYRTLRERPEGNSKTGV